MEFHIFADDLKRVQEELDVFIEMAEEEYDKSIERARKKLSYLPIPVPVFPPIVMHYLPKDDYVLFTVMSGTPKFMNRFFKKKMVKNLEKFLKAKGIKNVKVEFVKVN